MARHRIGRHGSRGVGADQGDGDSIVGGEEVLEPEVLVLDGRLGPLHVGIVPEPPARVVVPELAPGGLLRQGLEPLGRLDARMADDAVAGEHLAAVRELGRVDPLRPLRGEQLVVVVALLVGLRADRRRIDRSRPIDVSLDVHQPHRRGDPQEVVTQRGDPKHRRIPVDGMGLAVRELERLLRPETYQRIVDADPLLPVGADIQEDAGQCPVSPDRIGPVEEDPRNKARVAVGGRYLLDRVEQVLGHLAAADLLIGEECRKRRAGGRDLLLRVLERDRHAFGHAEDRVHRVRIIDVVRGDQRRVDGPGGLAVQDVVDEAVGRHQVAEDGADPEVLGPDVAGEVLPGGVGDVAGGIQRVE